MHGGEEEKLVKMQTRYVERTGNVGREKRGLDSTSSGDEGEPDRKKPALARMIVEALKVESLQKLCSSLEPILRRIVSEELERALAKLGPAKLSITGRPSPKHIEGPDGRKLQLHFKSKLSLPLFTGGKVEGEHGSAICIFLIDASTGRIVTSGPESSVKLDVIVLEGDFNNEDDNWSQEEFDSHIVREREGKRPLLTGDLQVSLKEGVGTLGELLFTDNSSWIRSRKFRLGAKVATGCCEAIRIREAKTDAFTVKDHRGELYKKHYPPALTDEVWRLEKIGKDGSFHKRLSKSGIYNVEDFLRHVVRDSQRLRNILGSGMSNKMWDVLVEHARTCVLSGKLYVYYPDDAKNVGVVFNNIHELRGLLANGEFHSAESLSENQRVFADGLVTQAYENWMHVTEYDSKSLLEKQNQSVPACQADFQSGQQQEDIPNAYVPNLSATAPPQQPVAESNPTIGGYEDDVAAARFSLQSQTGNLMAPYHLDATSLPPQNLLINALHQSPFPRNENLPLAPSQLPAADFQSTGTSNINSFTTAEDLFSEEMLENEDMQSFLRMFNMGGQGLNPFNVADGFPCSSPYMPTPPPDPQNFIDDQSRSSGKAVVGWLKLKAALRWGLFVRKKAAERRAQLVELDDM